MVTRNLPVNRRRPRPVVRTSGVDAERIAEIAGAVPDPELPMISLANLGVLRAVDVDDTGHIEITITPTYSGCPATKMMADDIEVKLREAGYTDLRVNTVLAQTWSSDDVSEAGRTALHDAGIAPPTHLTSEAAIDAAVSCPLCGSADTKQISRFGATSCKALLRCRSCHEPFEYFKVH